MKIQLISYGAALEVTGSKHCLDVDGIKILVDCGMFQGKRKETEEKNRHFPFDAKSIDYALCTHGHFDHCGNYPTLFKNGYKGNVYCSHATKEIAKIVLEDSAHIQKADIEYIKKRARKRGLSVPNLSALYTINDVDKIYPFFNSLPYNAAFQMHKNITAILLDAGHILGSSIVVFEIIDGKSKTRIAFTGDLGRKDLPILKDPEILDDIDYVICESTYGNSLHDEVDSVVDDFAKIINDTYKKNGKIIIPAFSIGRTQEIIYILHGLLLQKKIPEISVYVDSPMATNITELFVKYKDNYDEFAVKDFLEKNKNPFAFNQLHYIRSVEESKQLNTLKKPAIIISASGMCESGRVLHHLTNSVENTNNSIIMVGYMAENTLGRKIVEKYKEIKIFGELYQLKASVYKINALSAHADYNEIDSYLQSIRGKKPKKIFLVHGEKEACYSLQEKLKERLNCNIEVVLPGKNYIFE